MPSGGPPGEGIVRAAGGLPIRDGVDGSPRVALVHRPRYDDWTFPKGKLLDDRESVEAGALREVAEETGFRAGITKDLGAVEYRDRNGRRKVVRYFAMEVEGDAGDDAFTPSAEVDELRWATFEEANALLTYERDRTLLRALQRGAGDGPAYLIRHAQAGNRDRWDGPDDLRPLTGRGRRQAGALVGSFAGFELARIASSPSVRCVETVRPLAGERGLPIETFPGLAEGASLDEARMVVDALAAEPSALCSHGDVISAIVLDLAEHGTELVGEREWKKGSTWVLERRGGRIVRARYRPPPRSE
jgi:8-oxo-dGTP pyrophosphatase MutT (NUDIX family)/phosphohistidine phosphatase SixA